MHIPRDRAGMSSGRGLITRSGVYVFCTLLHSSSDRVEDGTQEFRSRREEDRNLNAFQEHIRKHVLYCFVTE